MNSTNIAMTIGALAATGGVNVETVRYYQRRGLIAQPVRLCGGVRRYGRADAERLRFIKRAQAMGFTLTEIASLLTLQTRRSCRATRELAAAKLQAVDARIRELRHLRREIVRLVAECDANTEDTRCPVMDRLVQ
ncbi:MAG TPA: MerR family DNA-binding protein [Steroidobacteraceae bacterium]|nr:MerR family DNA-binding protein [Steroidobacteraceae bacterium]